MSRGLSVWWYWLQIGYLVYDLMLVLHQLAVFPDWSVVVHHVLILTAWTAGLVHYPLRSTHGS